MATARTSRWCRRANSPASAISSGIGPRRTRPRPGSLLLGRELVRRAATARRPRPSASPAAHRTRPPGSPTARTTATTTSDPSRMRATSLLVGSRVGPRSSTIKRPKYAASTSGADQRFRAGERPGARRPSRSRSGRRPRRSGRSPAISGSDASVPSSAGTSSAVGRNASDEPSDSSLAQTIAATPTTTMATTAATVATIAGWAVPSSVDTYGLRVADAWTARSGRTIASVAMLSRKTRDPRDQPVGARQRQPATCPARISHQRDRKVALRQRSRATSRPPTATATTSSAGIGPSNGDHRRRQRPIFVSLELRRSTGVGRTAESGRQRVAVAARRRVDVRQRQIGVGRQRQVRQPPCRVPLARPTRPRRGQSDLASRSRRSAGDRHRRAGAVRGTTRPRRCRTARACPASAPIPEPTVWAACESVPVVISRPPASTYQRTIAGPGRLAPDGRRKPEVLISNVTSSPDHRGEDGPSHSRIAEGIVVTMGRRRVALREVQVADRVEPAGFDRQQDLLKVGLEDAFQRPAAEVVGEDQLPLGRSGPSR